MECSKTDDDWICLTRISALEQHVVLPCASALTTSCLYFDWSFLRAAASSLYALQLEAKEKLALTVKLLNAQASKWGARLEVCEPDLLGIRVFNAKCPLLLAKMKSRRS